MTLGIGVLFFVALHLERAAAAKVLRHSPHASCTSSATNIKWWKGANILDIGPLGSHVVGLQDEHLRVWDAASGNVLFED